MVGYETVSIPHVVPGEGLPAGVVEEIQQLVSSGAAQVVQEQISKNYGFTPTLEYCAKLIKFVKEMTDVR